MPAKLLLRQQSESPVSVAHIRFGPEKDTLGKKGLLGLSLGVQSAVQEVCMAGP